MNLTRSQSTPRRCRVDDAALSILSSVGMFMFCVQFPSRPPVTALHGERHRSPAKTSQGGAAPLGPDGMDLSYIHTSFSPACTSRSLERTSGCPTRSTPGAFQSGLRWVYYQTNRCNRGHRSALHENRKDLRRVESHGGCLMLFHGSE